VYFPTCLSQEKRYDSWEVSRTIQCSKEVVQAGYNIQIVPPEPLHDSIRVSCKGAGGARILIEVNLNLLSSFGGW